MHDQRVDSIQNLIQQDQCVHLFRDRYQGVQVRAQQGVNEGKRLLACFKELLATHPLAVIVGSSMPDLHPRMWKSAFEMLLRRDVVIGPTDRGGLYLLGMRKPWDVFRGIKWGTGTELVTLLKNVALQRSSSLQVRVEVFNVTNHVNFGQPSAKVFAQTVNGGGSLSPTAGRTASR